MNARARQLLDELLQLSVEDRALIADELDASIDADNVSPGEIEKAWAEEISRRVQDVRDGRSGGRDAFEVLAEIRADLPTKR
jgi:putative addiction module component (TIGR02574 family)